MTVFIKSAALAHIEEAALRAAPLESCGFLIGKGREIVTAVETKNRSNTPQTRFELDSTVHLRLQRELRNKDMSILGIFHSHPNGLAGPSKTDRDCAIYRGWIWLISALYGKGRCDTSAFLDVGHEFSALPLKRI